jgi:DNA-binding LacI/PurR family transcriptional regulator
VRQDFGSLGKLCVTMLLDAIHRGEDPAAAPDPGGSSMVEPQLVIRDSVASI